jgi:hypothetical protein
VFDGFTFVASGTYKPGPHGGFGEDVTQHGTRELPLPDRPQIGVQYVFHHPGPVDVGNLAMVELPARLRSAGITVVRAPKTSRDFMYLYIGGPLFVIRIREGRHEGVIYNAVDPNPEQRWGTDYVLVWLK